MSGTSAVRVNTELKEKIKPILTSQGHSLAWYVNKCFAEYIELHENVAAGKTQFVVEK